MTLHQAAAKFYKNPSELNRQHLLMACALDKMRRNEAMEGVYRWLKEN